MLWLKTYFLQPYPRQSPGFPHRGSRTVGPQSGRVGNDGTAPPAYSAATQPCHKQTSHRRLPEPGSPEHGWHGASGRHGVAPIWLCWEPDPGGLIWYSSRLVWLQLPTAGTTAHLQLIINIYTYFCFLFTVTFTFCLLSLLQYEGSVSWQHETSFALHFTSLMWHVLMKQSVQLK